MRVDYETQCAYHALTEQQKRQLPEIHRRAHLPGLFINIVDLIVSVIFLVELFSVLSEGYSINAVFKANDMTFSFGEFIGIGVICWILAAIVNAACVAHATKKYPFYTKKLGQHSFYLAKQGEGPRPGSGTPVARPAAPVSAPAPVVTAPRSAEMVCPECGRKQVANRKVCFFCCASFADLPPVQPETLAEPETPAQPVTEPEKTVMAKDQPAHPVTVYCAHCGKSQPGNRKTCFFCRTPLAAQEEGNDIAAPAQSVVPAQSDVPPVERAKGCCPKCGTKLTVNNSFCLTCGVFVN